MDKLQPIHSSTFFFFLFGWTTNTYCSPCKWLKKILLLTLYLKPICNFSPIYICAHPILVLFHCNILPCEIRYGSIFKTSLVGRPFIISADPELNHFIFQQEGHLFQSWYPESFTEILGSQNVGSIHGFMYKYLKSLILSLFGVESLKENLLPEIDWSVRRTLSAWSDQPSVEVRDAIGKVCIISIDLNP